jgi:hypothetical protein
MMKKMENIDLVIWYTGKAGGGRIAFKDSKRGISR